MSSILTILRLLAKLAPLLARVISGVKQTSSSKAKTRQATGKPDQAELTLQALERALRAKWQGQNHRRSKANGTINDPTEINHSGNCGNESDGLYHSDGFRRD